MSMSARKASSCTRQAGSTMARHFSIGQGPLIVALARSKLGAVQRHPSAKFRAASTKTLAMLPAHWFKRILKLGRLRLRGPWGAPDEFTLAAIAQNLRRLAKLVARPPPAAAVCVA